MARRVRSVRELREEHDAAVARGLLPDGAKKERVHAEVSNRARPMGLPRLKVVWHVCDQTGRTVATFAFAQKSDAEAHCDRLRSQGKGKHYIRADKVPMNS